MGSTPPPRGLADTLAPRTRPPPFPLPPSLCSSAALSRARPAREQRRFSVAHRWLGTGGLAHGRRAQSPVGAFAGSSPEPVPHQVLPVRGLRGDAARPDLPGPLPVLGAEQGGPGALHAGAQGERGPFLQASGRHASARHQGRVLRGLLRLLSRVRARPRHSDLQTAKSRYGLSGLFVCFFTFQCIKPIGFFHFPPFYRHKLHATK